MFESKKFTSFLVIFLPVLFILYELFRALEHVDSLAIKSNNLSTEIDYSYLKAPNKSSVTDIKSRLSEFKSVTINRADVEFGEHDYWYKVQIRNVKKIPRELTLLFDNPMQDRVRVYKLDQDWRYLMEFGDGLAGLPLGEVALPNLSFALEPMQEVSFLIHTSTLGTPHLPMAIFEQADFHRYRTVMYLVWGAFIGIVVLMIVYNLILYSGVKDIIYLLYSGYIGIFLIVLGFVHGFGVYILPSSVFQLLSTNIISLYYLLGVCLLLFSYYFLKLNDLPKAWLSQGCRILALTLLILGAISIGLPEYQAAKPFFVFQMLVYLYCLAMMLARLKDSYHWAKFYVVSWLPLFLGSTISTLMLMDGVDYGFWARHSALFGVMFEMAFISMALAERLRRSEEERLFQASHDHFFGFSNVNLLDDKIDTLAKSKNSENFSVVIIEIERYESLVPYVSAENLKDVIYRFLTDVELHLTQYLLVIDLDINANFKKSAMIREGEFGFIVSSNDSVLLSNALQEFSDKQPLSYQVNDITLNLNCTVGTAAYYDFKANPSELVIRAQQAIDIAQDKKSGYWIYSLSVKSEEGRKVKLASDLQKAIDQNELELFLQPQIDIVSGSPVGAEALLRWHHPVLGDIDAREVITVAEKTGLINKLSLWVFATACAHLKLLRQKGFKHLTVSVNFSAHDLILESFVTSVLSILDKNALKPDYFRLEFSEEISIGSSVRFAQNLSELRELGFGLTLDDFGTGYASLNYVGQLPFTEVKVDKSFISRIHSNAHMNKMTKAMIAMTKSMGLKVIAEGVEHSETYRLLSEFGCDLVQGYLLTEALVIDELIDWLEFEQIDDIQSQTTYAIKR